MWLCWFVGCIFLEFLLMSVASYEKMCFHCVFDSSGKAIRLSYQWVENTPHIETGLSIHLGSGNSPLKSLTSEHASGTRCPTGGNRLDRGVAVLFPWHTQPPGTRVHMFIQSDEFNPRLFVRDKRVGKHNKGYDDITRWEEIILASQPSGQRRGKKASWLYFFIGLMVVFRFFRILLSCLNFLYKWHLYKEPSYMQ